MVCCGESGSGMRQRGRDCVRQRGGQWYEAERQGMV